MSSSAIYTVNSNSEALVTGSVVPLGVTVRRFGSALENTGMSIRAKAAGYYKVDGTITIASAAVGPYVLEMYVNGVAYPGAYTSDVSATIGDAVTLSLPTTIVRKSCGCGDSLSITFVVTGIGALTNSAVTVEKM